MHEKLSKKNFGVENLELFIFDSYSDCYSSTKHNFDKLCETNFTNVINLISSE